MWVPVAVWQPCELLYTCYLLTYLLTHCVSVHQAAKLVTALLRVVGVTAGLADSNGSLPPGLWLTSPAGWLRITWISSGTLRSVIEYGLLLPFFTCGVAFLQNCFEDLLCYCEQCRSWSAGAVWRAGLCERTEVLVLSDRCQPVQSCMLSTQSHATPAIVVVVDSVDCLLRHTSIGAVAIVCVVASAKVNHSAPAACDECSSSSHHELVAACPCEASSEAATLAPSGAKNYIQAVSVHASHPHWTSNTVPVSTWIETEGAKSLLWVVRVINPQFLHSVADTGWGRLAQRITFMPRTRTRFGERGFSYCGPAASNTLPSDLHDITDTDTFRKRLKSVLYDRAYHWLPSALLDVSYSGALQISRWLIDRMTDCGAGQAGEASTTAALSRFGPERWH